MGTKRKYTLYMSNCIYYTIYIWTILYVASRFIESAVRVFRLIVSSPTYSWQLATLVALRILKILFKRCHPSHPPLSTSPVFTPNPSGASHLTNHPTLSGSVFLFPQFPNTKCFCVTQNEFKCDRHRRHLCDNVRRRAYIETYICIYNILYVCIHIQKIIQLPAESSDWFVGYFLRGRRESNSYKFPDILQDSDTKTDRNISFKVIARFGNSFTTCHFCSSI